MATIDDKVVSISFESSKFESGVNRTISSLDKLKAALHFPNAGKGLTILMHAAKRVDLGHIAKGVEEIRGALEALRLIAIGVLANLQRTAVRAGAAFVKAFTLDPIQGWFCRVCDQSECYPDNFGQYSGCWRELKEVNASS